MSENLFDRLFIFEMANNHMGSVEHGLRIIRAMDEARRGLGLQCAVKFQFRNLETFIHPDYRGKLEFKYVKRFGETRLDEAQFGALKQEADRLGFLTVCTPFDEPSVDLIERLGIAVVKIASCSLTDWPLLERIVKTDKPVIASTAGASLEDVDKVVSFLEHRGKNFALMHCVAAYPTPDEGLELNQIDLLRSRYPQVPVGYSTHERPDNFEAVRMAIAKGAAILERHVGASAEGIELNAYSSSPEQVRRWLEAARSAYAMCGVAGARMVFTDKELGSLRDLRRGVFAARTVAAGARLRPENVFFAIPTFPGQLTANDLSKYKEYYATEAIPARGPVMAAGLRTVDNRERVYAIVGRVKRLLEEGRVFVPQKLELEISHHYGIERFEEYGCVIINFINREYCKKLIVVLPGQKHPEQHHRLKEETFHLLWGDAQFTLDGRVVEGRPGDIMTVERGVRHIFTSRNGAVIEEISSTHFKDDSFYSDPAILSNPDRKTVITHWID